MDYSPSRSPQKANQWARASTQVFDRQTDPAWAWWPPARAQPGDSQERTRLRLAAANAMNLAPRDPRYYEPKKEAQWDNSSTVYDRYIPQYHIVGGNDLNCLGEIEPHIRRPTSKPRGDFVPTRLSYGRKTSPLISYDSIGWNRRCYEPVPDAARMHNKGTPYDPRSSTASFNHSMDSRGFGSPSSSPTTPSSFSMSRGGWYATTALHPLAPPTSIA